MNKKSTSKGVCCKGICPRYRAKRKQREGYYSSGYKRCNICDVFMDWTGKYCPCCGYQLRTKPRDRKLKERLNSEKLKTSLIQASKKELEVVVVAKKT